MDFSTFKEGQLRCVKTLDAPVAVSAGAGSGKTFTLTQRIAWALLPGSGADGAPFLEDIDQVLAITFTDKAAGEIKSRVKATLAAEGMAAQALKVDDAWISTIHGMCSRILRMHATELGVDPAFSVLDEATAADLFNAAVEEVLAEQNEFWSPGGLDALFSEYPARSHGGFAQTSIEDMIREIARAAIASPRGMECVCLPPQPRPAGVIARELLELAAAARDAAAPSAGKKSADAFLEKADKFLEKANALLASGEVSGEALLALADACPFPAANFGSKDYKALAKEMQREAAQLGQEARFAFAQPLLSDLVGLAGKVYTAYNSKKHEMAALDNDDLLILAARALKENERVREAFSDKFKLIMVDEFQDTDQLQIDMVRTMAGARGERLCTVGDAQQSIYRFRGADVAVYDRHVQHVRENDPSMPIVLPDNFRSHADILSFVDRIFEQREVFGESFMSLAPSRIESKVKRPFLAGPGRIDVLCTTYPGASGIDKSDVVALEARRIAERFAELREAGHAAGDMVVLLGRMTNADAYAAALRKAGFACVIAGGSIFSRAPEVRVVQRLAEVIANPKATASLFELLASGMFELSADDFIALSTCFDEAAGINRRRGLDIGFRQLAEGDMSNVSPQLACAVRVINALSEQAGVQPTSRIMMNAVRDSGWLTRLELKEAEGLSVAGNVFKAIRLVEGFEAQGARGPADCASRLAAHIERAKEAPGALSAEGGDFVRIMTVHASKGLEFPIVAVAEMATGAGRSSAFALQTIDGVSYVSLAPQRSVASAASTSLLKKCASKDYAALLDYEGEIDAAFVANASSAALRREAMAEYESTQELQERRRLLYVALTRAKEALVVAMTTKRDKEGGPGASSGVYGDIAHALFGEGSDIPEKECAVPFGGSAPARVSRYDVHEGEFDAPQAEGSAKAPSGDAPCEASGAGEDGPVCTGDCSARSGVACVSASKSAGIREASDASCDQIVGTAHDACVSRSLVDVFEPMAASELDEVAYKPARDNVTSYSALAQAHSVHAASASDAAAGEAVSEISDDDAFWEGLGARLLADADKATDVGSAFHVLAQRAARRAVARGEGGRPAAIEMPSREAIDAAVRRMGCAPAAVDRVQRALERWCESSVAANMVSHRVLRAELPFFVAFPVAEPGGECAYLEGSMDLFACDEMDAGDAYIVDYKTGGSPKEHADDLAEKHRLQAECYAYAALEHGFSRVQATFVRVEAPAEDGSPQTVHYLYERSDRPQLLQSIQGAWAALREGN